MHCAAHSEVEASGACAICFKNVCDACATYELGGNPCCERCGSTREAERDALSSGLLALIGVGYLGTLAIGVAVFNARPIVGGIAAIVAIALGRAMQLYLHAAVVSRRASSAPRT